MFLDWAQTEKASSGKLKGQVRKRRCMLHHVGLANEVQRAYFDQRGKKKKKKKEKAVLRGFEPAPRKFWLEI